MTVRRPSTKLRVPSTVEGRHRQENAFLVKRISCKCFEFHVSGFKLCESDWRNSEVEPETWNLKLET